MSQVIAGIEVDAEGWAAIEAIIREQARKTLDLQWTFIDRPFTRISFEVAGTHMEVLEHRGVSQ